LLVRSFVDLLPAIAAVIFSGNAGILAVILAAVGVGALFSGFVAAYPGTIAKKVERALIFLVISAVGLFGLVVTDWIWLGIAGAIVSGLGMTVSAIIVLTLVQGSVAEAMRGRVLSLYGMIWRGGSAIGALAMGLVADIISLRSAFMASALLSVLIYSAIAVQRKRIADALTPSDEH
jgi:MFS family permease